MYNSVHYVDHLTFLSTQTPSKHGIMSTFWPVKAGPNWSIDLNLTWNGELKT